MDDEDERNLTRMASFDSLSEVDKEKVPTLGSVCCFFKDHIASDLEPAIDPVLVIYRCWST